jgi:phosphatidylcholine synthase
MNNKNNNFSLTQYILAWLIHVLTASGVFLGVMSLIKIYEHQYLLALWFMAATVVIDAVDGTLARLVSVKSVLPKIDGTLLDNIVDYLNYVIAPCMFLLVKPDMLPDGYELWIVAAITLTSSYQFCQADAKTPDHFFKGFPCYWNIVVFYMFILNSTAVTNASILTILCVFIFVPIKYVYPSRLDFLTDSKQLKVLMHVFSSIFGISSVLILWNFPNNNPILLFLSLGYVVLYLALSVYRTYYPMIIAKLSSHKLDHE